MRGYSKEPLRALIVEDDLPLQEILTKLLQSRGFIVTAVASVAESLAHLRTERPPHCLLLDLKLPDGDGTDVLQYVRDQKIYTIVAVVTGTMNAASGSKVLDGLRPDKILRKPFGVCDVEDWLAMAVEKCEAGHFRKAV